MVQEFWRGGYKYFIIDLDNGEARMCLSPAKGSRIDLSAYGVETFPRGKVYYVDFLKVSKHHRNLGHGVTLLMAAIRWANISKNIIILDAIPLDTGIDGHRLIRFYLKHGFKIPTGSTNQHSMYYHDRDVIKRRKLKVHS